MFRSTARPAAATWKQLERETLRLDRIVKDLLDLARIENEAGALDVRVFASGACSNTSCGAISAGSTTGRSRSRSTSTTPWIGRSSPIRTESSRWSRTCFANCPAPVTGAGRIGAPGRRRAAGLRPDDRRLGAAGSAGEHLLTCSSASTRSTQLATNGGGAVSTQSIQQGDRGATRGELESASPAGRDTLCSRSVAAERRWPTLLASPGGQPASMSSRRAPGREDQLGITDRPRLSSQPAITVSTVALGDVDCHRPTPSRAASPTAEDNAGMRDQKFAANRIPAWSIRRIWLRTVAWRLSRSSAMSCLAICRVDSADS